ncbi:MAG TPA: YegS/Rv2252/BmrU family lipid kinase [Candidatus Fimimorpha faecalis]|uniref:YegS/Rv2252/BmrU family lipid kinase n=1 Tax=Candidatus Fimimorpha faecalis TaxID=2840824 RepID=A0A9D1ECV6_9FIRM|nr:YegS/Rv2252/BmrU family lipid kinase [Candidatus Fimimorpha faecalis]
MINVIVNPNSRSGKGMKVWNKVEGMFQDSGKEYKVYFTQFEGHAKQIAAELTKIHSNYNSEIMIVVVGGDGTINEVINGIAFERNVVLGYIPTGSGNDFARSLKCSEKCLEYVTKRVKHILNPSEYEWLDYGVVLTGGEQVTNRRFAVSCGMGMDAEVCYDLLNSKTKRFFNRYHLTRISYLLTGIYRLLHFTPVDGVLEIDTGKKYPMTKICFVSFHIHPFEGGGFKFAPKANYSDGLIDVCMVYGRGKLSLVPILLKAILGHHIRKKGVRIVQCKEARLIVNEPCKVHADGEAFGMQDDISVRCISKRIRIIR